jgi:hypothetical protein
MKLPSLLLAGSLVANVALATVLYLRATEHSSRFPDLATASPSAELPPVLAANVNPETWANLGAQEPADFVAGLRAEGFPPAVIRALVRQWVRDHFRARYEALAEAEAAKPYWRKDGRFSTDAKLNAERRALGRESQAMLAELLGPDAVQPTPEELGALQHRFGNLPPAKLTQLQKITADYNDLTKQVSDAADGIMLPQDRATLALLQKERDADTAQLLSPDETMEYELHHSSTANRLLTQLAAFDPTEQEFRALFALNRAIDAEYGNPGVLSQEQRRARADALKQLTPKIEAALGPERFADYQQAIDPNYQQAVQLVTRLELPKETAAQLVAVQKDVTQRMAALSTDRTLSNDQRRAQIAALHEEATAKLTSALGPRGLQAYKDNSGAWLQDLQRAAIVRPAANPRGPAPTP